MNPIKSIVGSLAGFALKKHLDKGGKVEIPSLGITFDSQEPSTAELVEQITGGDIVTQVEAANKLVERSREKRGEK